MCMLATPLFSTALFGTVIGQAINREMPPTDERDFARPTELMLGDALTNDKAHLRACVRACVSIPACR